LVTTSGVFRGHFLDLHAAFRRRHEGVAPGAAVERDAEVELAGDVAALLEVDLAHFLARGPRLVGDQLHAHHLREDLAGLLRALGELDAAALAAPARVDLRFDDRDGIVLHQLARGGHRFVGALHQLAFGDRHAERAQDPLGLVLVDLHGRAEYTARSHRASRDATPSDL
jgi:hypothetical protein